MEIPNFEITSDNIVLETMGLCIEFTFPDGKTVDACMCYSSFPAKILNNLTQEQYNEFIPHWLGEGDEPTEGLTKHTCKFVKIIYDICKEEDYIRENMLEDPVSMIFC